MIVVFGTLGAFLGIIAATLNIYARLWERAAAWAMCSLGLSLLAHIVAAMPR